MPSPEVESVLPGLEPGLLNNTSTFPPFAPSSNSLKMHIPPLVVAVYPVVTMSHGRQSRSARSTSSAPNSTGSPDFSSIQKVIRNILRSSRISLQQVERLQSTIHQAFLIRLVDGSSLLMKCPARPNTPLLRHEQRGLEAEAKVLGLLGAHSTLPVSQVLKYDHQGTALGAPFLMTSYLSGRRLSEFTSHLSANERAAIDRNLGAYVRRITSLAAPSFGLTYRVFGGRGNASWSEAFISLLEAALRDAEDMLVNVPYESIRYNIARHSHALDQVTEARLVPLSACTAENVLLDDRTRQITGLVGFSNVVWGDPLMARAFSEASEAFFEGYGECPARLGDTRVRQLIYTIYRAVTDMITHYYRPQVAVDELEARRSLTLALNQLARL